MRCPKCGYISFDHLESCKKCRKNISEASADLDGTVFAVSTPVFLDLEYEEAGAQAEDNEDTLVSEENLDDVDETMDLSFESDDVEVGDELVMDLEGDEGLDDFALAEETDDESTLELDDLEEVPLEDEVSLDLSDEEETPGSDDDLQLDFGDIDISDLGPPGEGGEEELVTETLTLDEETSMEAAVAGGPPAAPPSVAPGSGLEDLQIDDLDLDTPAQLVAGSKAGDKMMPSVKTGTALDDFEIDLGELTSADK